MTLLEFVNRVPEAAGRGGASLSVGEGLVMERGLTGSLYFR